MPKGTELSLSRVKEWIRSGRSNIYNLYMQIYIYNIQWIDILRNVSLGDFFMTIIQHMSTVVYHYILYIIVQGSAVGLFITPSPQTHLSALLKSYRTNDVCVGHHWPKHHHAVRGCIMKFLMPDLNYHWADPYNFCCSVYLCKY